MNNDKIRRFNNYLDEYITETETYELTAEEVKFKFKEIFEIE